MTSGVPGPGPVPGFDGWVWWRGVNGMLYARRPKTSPPKTARAHNFTVLVARIRRAEGAMPDVPPRGSGRMTG